MIPHPPRFHLMHATLLLALLAISAFPSRANAQLDFARPLLVAHRGASAYAPEHTMEAYRLAIRQGAHLIEPDLQITADGTLIALHDVTLDRTTDVETVFPDRYREVEIRGEIERRWFVVDFTLEEIRRLDAGSWFDPSFAGSRTPTLGEVIELALGSGVGIFPETKAPEVYLTEGFEMERLLVEELRRHGLDRRGAIPDTPVLVQSFSEASLRVLRHELKSDLNLTFLLGGSAGEWLSPDALARVGEFADGIGPAKSLLFESPGSVASARSRGLHVVPYTFRASSPDPFGTVEEEMRYFLCELRVDGLFTDNPDLFPDPGSCNLPRSTPDRGPSSLRDQL